MKNKAKHKIEKNYYFFFFIKKKFLIKNLFILQEMTKFELTKNNSLHCSIMQMFINMITLIN
jgi:hypothetical protein